MKSRQKCILMHIVCLHHYSKPANHTWFMSYELNIILLYDNFSSANFILRKLSPLQNLTLSPLQNNYHLLDDTPDVHGLVMCEFDPDSTGRLYETPWLITVAIVYKVKRKHCLQGKTKTLLFSIADNQVSTS